MNRFKKLTIGASLLTVLVLSGCTKGGEDSESVIPAASDKAATEAAAGQANEFGWVKPAKTTVIDFYQADRSNPDVAVKKAELMHKYLLDNFNVDLKKSMFDIDPKEK